MKVILLRDLKFIEKKKGDTLEIGEILNIDCLNSPHCIEGKNREIVDSKMITMDTDGSIGIPKCTYDSMNVYWIFQDEDYVLATN